MKLIKLNLLVILVFLLIGCANKEYIIRTEYVRVEVPVVYKIDKPTKPRLTKDKSIPSYLSEILAYTELLETIINEHNKGNDE